MFEKIVVPLDGSDLAEVALPCAKNVAVGNKASKVVLISVTEEIKGSVARGVVHEGTSAREFHMPPSVRPMALGNTYSGLMYTPDSNEKQFPTEVGRMAKTAYSYLAKKAEQLNAEGLQTDFKVLVGNPADEILRFAREEEADLLVIASQGKSGFNKWHMGNIADKVVKDTQIPVLLVKPETGFKETKPKRRGEASVNR